MITVFFQDLLDGLITSLSIDPSTATYVRRRFKNEGVSFLSVTLPKLWKSVLAALECPFGRVSWPTDFAWKGRVPREFRGLLLGIVTDKGYVRRDIDVVSFYSLRQFCEYFYKLSFGFEKHEIEEATKKYLEVESCVNNMNFNPEWVKLMRKNFHNHYRDIANASICSVFMQHRPRFGPGAFFGSENNSEPYYVRKQMDPDVIGTCRTDQKAFSGFFKAYPSSPESIRVVPEGKCSKVLFVPKDSRGPRIISKEPLHLLRAQLAYFDWLSAKLERTCKGSISFKDQSTNRQIAAIGSKDRSYATLDLKDASDRVSYRLCQELFQYSPAIRYAISHFRSTSAELPNGRVIKLGKLAGMGSGLTFATMALVIHLSVCTRISLVMNIPYEEVSSKVFVYGDDLAIPKGWFSDAIIGLESSGLQVNKDKCFIHSHFRESCGGDYLNGNDVAPVRLKLANAGLKTSREERRGMNLSSGIAILELERHARELVGAGLIHVSEVIYKAFKRAKFKLPLVTGESPVLGRYTTSLSEVLASGDQEYARVPVPSVKQSNMFPYKFLATRLTKKEDVLDKELGFISAGLEYGGLAVPRDIKLVKKLVYNHNRR